MNGFFKIGNIYSIDQIFEMSNDPMIDPFTRKKILEYKKQFLEDIKRTQERMKKQARAKGENKSEENKLLKY